ncbi:unnamed protein product [Chrysoparadoxa australica]
MDMDIERGLTDQERQVFSVLRGALSEAKASTVVRVAGGWVRDKLLGLENDDIDLALDDCSGVAFAELVNTYLKSNGHETHTIGVVKANPDQSKHLETARVKVQGLWLDMVNLRSETYQDDSRIPLMKFGTAKEDAFRRDFTLNALFYNLNTSLVEDLTERGLSDLYDGVIHTPLSPDITLQDDPLRALRAVRFAARFSFRLADELRDAASSDALHKALGAKVSRERIGVEVTGMLSGKMARPLLAISLLHQLGLLSIILPLPPGTFPAVSDTCPGPDMKVPPQPITVDWSVSTQAAELASALIRSREGCQEAGLPQPGHFMTFLCAMLLPVQGMRHQVKRSYPLAAGHIVREGLKLKAKDATDACCILEELPELIRLAETASDPSRLDLGLSLRRLKELWPVGFDLACITELLQVPQEQKAATVSKYEALAAAVDDLGLGEVWKLRPLLDGKAVQEMVGVPRGAMVGKVIEEEIRWQLQHPAGTAEECLEHIIAAWKSMQ